MRLSALAISVVLVFGCVTSQASEFSANSGNDVQQTKTLSPAIADSLFNFQPSQDDVEDFDEYFYFHKSAVNYEGALSDVKQCDSYNIRLAPMSLVPDFIPFGADRGNVTGRYNSSPMEWGIVGGIVGAIAISDVGSNMSRANLRNCMRNLGYRRYGISRDIWKQIHAGNTQEIEERLAAIASGPQPHRGGIEP